MRCIAIDWSGARNPRGKIWLAEANAGELRRLEALPGRREAIEQLIHARNQDGETIVGLDFAFSLPEWFLRANGCACAFELWRVDESDGERWLDSCDPPFWGRCGKKKPVFEADFRTTELKAQQ